MDAYISEYTNQNVPLFILSGLSENASDGIEKLQKESAAIIQGNGPKIESQVPIAAGELQDRLLAAFQALSVDSATAGQDQRQQLSRCQIHAVRRRFVFPHRKAAPPASSPSLMSMGGGSSSSTRTLHSPLSPLSPGSPIFPDGMMTPLWISKHQHFVPAVFVCFYNLSADLNENTLRDNELKNDIVAIKGMVQRSGYKTRFAVVLISEASTFDGSDLEERVGLIRRAGNLEMNRSLFVIAPRVSGAEPEQSAATVLNTLRPQSLEYYRDLEKHARRKKSRGAAPPPTSPPVRQEAHPLSQQGWNVRYEFKMGVFAEFYSDTAAAARHYNAALDSLIEGILPEISDSASRWHDARYLADVLALRMLRCMLLDEQTTQAVRLWTRFRNVMSNFTSRQKEDLPKYGWEAWQSRWTFIMAQIINDAQLRQMLGRTSTDSRASQDRSGAVILPKAPIVYVRELSTSIGLQLPPWQNLHHPGYWYLAAARHTLARRDLAHKLTAEDRATPESMSASQIASRYNEYDLYLCPPPCEEYPLDGHEGFDHSETILQQLDLALQEFRDRKQPRMASKIQFDMARELIRVQDHEEALRLLKPLYTIMRWRREGWADLMAETIKALHECNMGVAELERLVASNWEASNKALPAISGASDYFAKVASAEHDQEHEGENLLINLTEEDTVGLIACSCSFAQADIHVGDVVNLQIAVTSRARAAETALALSKLVISFGGSLESITIQHDPNAAYESPTDCQLVELDVEETSVPGSRQRLSGNASLLMHPAQTKVFQIAFEPFSAGDVSALRFKVSLKAEGFELQHESRLPNVTIAPRWYRQVGTTTKGRPIMRCASHSLNVHARRQRLELELPDLQQEYLAREKVQIPIEVFNGENEQIEAILRIEFKKTPKNNPAQPESVWNYDEWSLRPYDEGPDSAAVETAGPQSRKLGAMASEKRSKYMLCLEMPTESCHVEMTIHSEYDLAGVTQEEMTPIPFNFAFDIREAFRIEFDLFEWKNPNGIANGFQPTMQDAKALEGLDMSDPLVNVMLRWKLLVRLKNISRETLNVNDVGIPSIVPLGVGKYPVTAEKVEKPRKGQISPNEQQTLEFELEEALLPVIRNEVKGLRPLVVVTWSRSARGSQEPASASQSNFRGQVDFPNNAGDPRVFCEAFALSSKSSDSHFRQFQLVYTLENASTFHLEWEIEHGPTDEYLFSGPKRRMIGLTPISRAEIRYTITVVDSDVEIVRPVMRIEDRQFAKTLHPLPGQGIQRDSDGLHVVIKEHVK